MSQLINTIVDKMVARLPDESTYITPQELLELGFPQFFVERVQIELEKNLAESVMLPDSDWAEMHADEVQDAWFQFLRAIRAETRIPVAYARSVFETAVEDILEILIEPRTKLPEYLFGTVDSLSSDVISVRTRWIVVYKYLGTALVRYMEKKNMEEISREQAARVIAAIDSKMTENYTPLNWAQLLQPWFELMGEPDSLLISRFFADKKMDYYARQFAKHDGSLGKSDVIEFMSLPFKDDEEDSAVPTVPESPDTDDHDNQHESNLSAVKSFMDASGSDKPSNDTETDEAFGIGDEQPVQESEEEEPVDGFKEDKYEDSIPDSETPETEPESNENDSSITDTDLEPENITEEDLLPDEDLTDENETDSEETAAEAEVDLDTDNETEEDPDQEPESLDDDTENEPEPEPDDSEFMPPKRSFKLSEESEKDDFGVTPEALEDEPSEETEQAGDDTGVLKEIPMWQRYIPESEIASSDTEEPEPVGGYQPESFKDESDDDKPLIDMLSEATLEEPEETTLLHYMMDRKEEMTNSLFGGDENAFLLALEDIENMNDWSAAGKYISSEIFRRNMIDLYSDEAIDFTDRIQTYFLEKSKF